jgi:Protein of unknown function (DUF1176)
MRRVLTVLVAMLAIAGGAHAAGTKAVKDWLGVCDNTGACTAFGFGAQEDQTGAYLILRRDAGPVAQPSLVIVFDAGDTQPSAEWTLTLDHHPIAGVGPVHARGSDSGARATLTAGDASALIAALRSGQSLNIAAAGKSLDEISLSGSAAILLWLDAQQGRIGTVSALERPGPKLASALLPPLRAPLIRAAAAVDQKGVPARAPKGMTKDIADCDLDPTLTPDDIVARLAPGLMLWGPQCGMGAYNEVNVFFLGNEQATDLKPIRFPEPPGAGQASDETLFNASFDPNSQTLAMFSKARGLADCGERADWVWDGKSFQLISDNIMPQCRGVAPDDWPALFVSRRN